MVEMTLSEWSSREVDKEGDGWVVIEVEGMKNASAGFPYVVCDPVTATLLSDYIENWRPPSKSNRVFLTKTGEEATDATLYYWANLHYSNFRLETQVHFERPLLQTFQFTTQRRAINTWTRHVKNYDGPPIGLVNQALVQLEETGESQYTRTAACSEALGVARWTHATMAKEVDPNAKSFHFSPIATKPAMTGIRKS